jgi:SRSO17 transposase
VSGLLSEQPTKNCAPVAAVRPERREQQLQALLTDLGWEEQALKRQRIAPRLRLPRAGEGVLILEETEFDKKGRCSAGGARP